MVENEQVEDASWACASISLLRDALALTRDEAVQVLDVRPLGPTQAWVCLAVAGRPYVAGLARTWETGYRLLYVFEADGGPVNSAARAGAS